MHYAASAHLIFVISLLFGEDYSQKYTHVRSDESSITQLRAVTLLPGKLK
jgi:hypothetical protein